jgi:serine/threonine protein kinase
MVRTVRALDSRELAEYKAYTPYNYPSIASFIGIQVKASIISLVRDWIAPPRDGTTPHADVEAQLSSGPGFSTDAIFIIALGVAKALAHIHAAGDVHGNLRSSNVLLNERYEPFVVGYGIAPSARARETLDMRTHGESSLFCAPEVCQSSEFSAAADIFAFGTFLYVIHGCPLPCESLDVREHLIKGNRPDITVGLPAPYRNLVEECWESDPLRRPSAQQVVQRLLSPAFDSMVPRQRLAEYLSQFHDEHQ